MTLRLSSPVDDVKGVGKKYLQIFAKQGIHTVSQLLLHFPASYIDFARASEKVEPGVKKLYRFRVLQLSTSLSYARRRRLTILKVSGRVGNEPVVLVFFNQHYLASYFDDRKDTEIHIYGVFLPQKQHLQATTPLTFASPGDEPVIPLYDKIGTIKSGTLKKIIANALDHLEDDFEDLPTGLRDRYGFPGIVEGLKAIHRPKEADETGIRELKQRFIYSEFFFFQLELQTIRNHFKSLPRSHKYRLPENFAAEVARRFPFPLTKDQQTVCSELAEDLRGETTMQRLLQGDVGSGKTVVAFGALLAAQQSGFQGALLAPTEILARQHFANARAFFPGAMLEILTGSTPAKEKKRIRQQLEAGEIDLLFGTHALLEENIRFKDLSMVVVDEQHRFGVSQRAALYYKGRGVDLLVTTATPIPRTMLLSLYGDLSVSSLKMKPAGRLPIRTKKIEEYRRHEFYKFLRGKIEKGEKAYIILPLIEESEFFTELRSLESEKEYFKKIFKGIPTGTVSGRTKPAIKDATLQAFAAGEIKVLISTTVIEVGIDVKDATYMVIENADRYGLSQLHQLRGRVGRGEQQSHCYLFSSPNISESGDRRLETIVTTDDGFEIAETDLKMRGGGIVSGLEQSGYLDFRVGNMRDHHDLFTRAQEDAHQCLRESDKKELTAIMGERLSEVERKLKAINFS